VPGWQAARTQPDPTQTPKTAPVATVQNSTASIDCDCTAHAVGLEQPTTHDFSSHPYGRTSSQSRVNRSATLSSTPIPTIATTPGTSLSFRAGEPSARPEGFAATKYPNRSSRCASSRPCFCQLSELGGGAGDPTDRALRAMLQPAAMYDPPDTEATLPAVVQLGPGASAFG
jgi:hypothetical protein